MVYMVETTVFQNLLPAAGHERIELSSYGFGDRCSAVELMA